MGRTCLVVHLGVVRNSFGIVSSVPPPDFRHHLVGDDVEEREHLGWGEHLNL